MKIEEMMNNRDFATNMSLAIQNQTGKDFTGIYNIEDFENCNEDEFKDFCLNEMKNNSYHALLFMGWAFTKELYIRMKNFYYSQDKTNENRFCEVMFLPELIGFVIFDTRSNRINFIKNLNNTVKEVSDLNIKDIIESDNGIQINYFTKSVVKYFDEKPKSIENIIGEE